MYLSGPPLHPLAIALVARFRERFGDRLPVSFSGGIDERNFADTVGLGLKPVTVCSDLLKSGGYRRGWRYFGELVKRMDAVGRQGHRRLRAQGAWARPRPRSPSLGLPQERAAACRAALADGGDPRAAAGDAFAAWVSAARVLNSAAYAERVLADRRYSAAENATPPKKIGSSLVLFDCLTCDKCIPVCPNDANFSFSIPIGETPVERLTPNGGRLDRRRRRRRSRSQKPQQIGAFADVCNECGHCDVLCPEDGGPYHDEAAVLRQRGRLRGRARTATASSSNGGDLGAIMRGRFGGRDGARRERWRRACATAARASTSRSIPTDVAGSVSGAADGPVDLTRLRIMLPILDAVAGPQAVNYVSAAMGRATSDP